MICPACGAAAPDDAKFCNACGASLSAQPDDTPNAVTTESPVVGEPVDDEQTGELRLPVDSATDELDE
ncbi:MAG: zinc-ribbon domain-containing protein, partial [Ilumatobacteraceae bacterium]